MKNRIKNNEVLMGAFLSEIAAPNLVRLMKAGGLEYVIVDCEHGYFDYSQVAAIAAVGRGIGFPIIVRIPNISREHIQKYLDSGVDGLLSPMVETVDDVRNLIKFSKYQPIGERGISTMRPHSDYNPGKLSDYTKKANDQTMIFIQIETKKGLSNIEDISKIPNLDGIFIGPNDLACDFGTMGNFYTEDMKNAINKIIKYSKLNKKSCGIITSDMKLIKECEFNGMNLFSCNSELGLLKNGIKEMLKKFKE